ncbi:TauD-domain-containing protein [Hesseltinella vesiculosa]|uniref:TauD-domain-containing protein n=1 Tax=Hesseltinella vesiculosa TaxID=101127 RepID=A0A1X2G6B6_9FUNG|nr:TauD-domain-containing protein [Hesseltinella vesiculosa]
MAPNTEALALEQVTEYFEKLAIDGTDKYVVFPNVSLEPLEPFEHQDPGHLADPTKTSILEQAESVVTLTPHIGTEIHGLQLSKLTEQQKNDLALLVEERGVVFFKNQDISTKQLVDLGKHYGPLHHHPVGGHEEDSQYAMSIYSDSRFASKFRAGQNSQPAASTLHSDITFEKQPAGITFLKLELVPKTGGDTIWYSAYEAYDRLSPALQRFLEGLRATHQGDIFEHYSKFAGIPLRREVPQDTTHPVVRTHPVTGWKSLFVQPGFTRSIVGLRKHESDALLKLLYEHLGGGYDFQVRYKWGANDVAIWDNRVTNHCAIPDYQSNEKRYGFRVTSTAEAPYFDPKSKSRRQDLEEAQKY